MIKRKLQEDTNDREYFYFKRLNEGLDAYTINIYNEYLYTYNENNDLDYFLFKVLDEGVTTNEVIQYLVEVEGWDRTAVRTFVKKGPYGDFDLTPQQIEELDNIFGSCQDYEDFVSIAFDEDIADSVIVKYLTHCQGVKLRYALELVEII